MTINISEDEATLIEEALELAGVSTIRGLLNFVKEHSNEGAITFTEPLLLDLKMPAPKGKLHDVFVLTVNEFIRYAKEAGTYPSLPSYVGKKRLSFIISEHIQVNPRIASTKIDQLVATGWLETKYGNIQNPVKTWWQAKENKRPHPGILG